MEPFTLYPFILYQDSTLASPTKNLGLCYLVNNDTITAVSYLKKSFELNPYDTQLGMDLWRYYTFVGEPIMADYYKTKAETYRRQ